MTFLKHINISESPILNAKALVLWKKKLKSYNFTSLPKTVILTPNTSYVNLFKKITTKQIKGLSGKNYIIHPHYLLSFQFGIGAPAMVSHLEELKVLGVESFIFIGFAGILNKEIQSSEAYSISTAFSASGTSYFYNINEKITYKNPIYQSVKSKLKLQETTCISTDAPFKESKTFLKEYIKKGANLIDMETASILAFSKYHQVNTICILIASDSLISSDWSPPKNMSVLTKKVAILIKDIIK